MVAKHRRQCSRGSTRGVVDNELNNAGIRMLTHVGLDENTTRFLTDQVAVAHGNLKGTSVAAMAGTRRLHTGVKGSAVHAMPTENNQLFNATHVQNDSQFASLIAENNTPAMNADAMAENTNPQGVHTTNRLVNLGNDSHTRDNGMIPGPQPMGIHAFAAANQGITQNYMDTDGESSTASGNCKISKKKKSGMMAKPTDNIKTQEVWPHYNLGFGFITAAIPYNQITFEQYRAGEFRRVGTLLKLRVDWDSLPDLPTLNKKDTNGTPCTTCMQQL